MAANVTIKSYTNGLKVFLNDQCDFNDIILEVEDKFTSSKNFFKGSKIAVSFEGRVLTNEEENLLVSKMEKCGELAVLYIVGKDSETDEMLSKAVVHSFPYMAEEPVFGKLYPGTLKKGEHLEVESGLVILGDVEPGASVIAKGNVVIIGGLYGSCTISASDDNFYFIAANDISSDRIKISGIKYTSIEKAKWLIKPKMQSKIAYINDNQVIVEPINKDILNNVYKKIREC